MKKMTHCCFYWNTEEISGHYRAYSLSLIGSFTVAWKTDSAAQKDVQCELKLPSLHHIHWMPLVSPGLCKTKISLLDRFSSRPQGRSKISKGPEDQTTIVDLYILINWTSLFPLLGVNGVLLRFYYISNKNSCNKQCRLWSDAAFCGV